MSPTSQTPTRNSLFDSCHRKIRLIGGGPVAFLGGLVAKARRKERDGDQSSTDTKLYLEESVLERKLPEADLKALVDLPAGLDYNEWLASHTLALFEHVNLVYGTISEFCTPSGCPDMIGPGNRTYLWFDEKGKKTRVAAPQYIDYVMTFTQKTVSDESIFPTKYANEFPSSFESIARKILRLQFHVIAHLYAAHFREIALLGLHTHLNLTFAHLTALHRRFNLIDEKETDVLRDLEVALRLTDANCSGPTQASSETASMVTTSTTASTTSNYTPQCSSGGDGGTSYVNNYSSNIKNTMPITATVSTHHIEQQRYYQQLQQAPGSARISTNTEVNNLGSGESLDDFARHAGFIDGDASVLPICTQPEAASKPPNAAAVVFSGGDGLIGGILGDLSSGEFVETTRYSTAAMPLSTTNNSNFCDNGVGGIGNNGGVGALHLNLNNNNHNLHYHHHHHVHHLLQQHHHHHPFPHPHQQNSGLIQCNVSNAPNASATATPTTASTATVAATPSTNTSSTAA